MNKAASAAAAAAVLLIVGLPPVLGFVTEAQLRARTAEISASQIVRAEVRSFERGWFGGRAKVDLALSPAYARELGAANAARGGPNLDALISRTFPVDVRMAFGPIAVLDGVHFGLSKMIASLDRDVASVVALERNLGVSRLFEFRGSTGLFGTLTFDANVSPIDFAANPARVAFSGLSVEGTFRGRKLAANGSVGQLQFSSPTGAFTLENVVVDIDNELLSRYVLPGNAAISVGRVAIVDEQRGTEPVLSLANLRVGTAVAYDAATSLLDVQATPTLDSAFIDGIELAEVQVAAAIRKLDPVALEGYTAALQSLAESRVGPDATMRELRPAIERLLATGPSVTLDPVSFRYGGEPFTGRFEIVTNAAAVQRAAATGFADPAALLALFGGSADLEVSKTLAQQLARTAIRMQLGGDSSIPPEQLVLAEAQSGLMLVALVGQGFLTDTGDGYRTELRVTNGGVTVNGAALPFSVP